MYIYILFPHHTTPPPLQPVPTIGLRVSVDVKHHVYKEREGGERERGERERGREIIDVNNCFCSASTLVMTLDLLSG